MGSGIMDDEKALSTDPRFLPCAHTHTHRLITARPEISQFWYPSHTHQCIYPTLGCKVRNASQYRTLRPLTSTSPQLVARFVRKYTDIKQQQRSIALSTRAVTVFRRQQTARGAADSERGEHRSTPTSRALLQYASSAHPSVFSSLLSNYLFLLSKASASSQHGISTPNCCTIS